MPVSKLVHKIQSNAWAASQPFTVDLGPTQGTVIALILIQRFNVTTSGSPTNFNDYWARAIARLNLTGSTDSTSQTFLDFTSMRLPLHSQRRLLGNLHPTIPTVIPISQTAQEYVFASVFWLGVQPYKDGRVNLRDLTGGIPQVDNGQLTLAGTWGAATAMGTGVTINSGTLDTYTLQIQRLPGESAAAIAPRAYPAFSMTSPTMTGGTTSVFNSNLNIQSGGFLQGLYVMTTRGTNAPRDSQVLNSARIFRSDAPATAIIEFGGQSTAANQAGSDIAIAEFFTQMGLKQPFDDDRSTLGVPTVAPLFPTNAGLYFFDLNQLTEWGVDPRRDELLALYGADVRQLQSGKLRFDYGIATSTGAAMDVLSKRYTMNENHPANAGIL